MPNDAAMTNPLDNLIGSPEACQILEIDRSTLSRWVQLGKLRPVLRLGESRNSQMVFDRSDVLAFKETR